MLEDIDIEVAVRRSRMRAAVADPHRSTTDTTATMAAGAGAELVARQQRACDVLATRRGKDREYTAEEPAHNHDLRAFASKAIAGGADCSFRFKIMDRA